MTRPAGTTPGGGRAAYGSSDPIAAIATPLSSDLRSAGALAIIRTSGGGTGEGIVSAIELLARVFSRPRLLEKTPGNSIVHGWILDASEGGSGKIDEVLVSVYRSPRSYTGEDGADISCHGGIAAVKAVLAVLKKAGFREALPGEFTFRAFMNGKLDLTRAESVMELVSAKTNKGREQAVRRLSGILENEISSIKNLLVEVLAGAEIYLDYSEDEFDDSENAEADDETAGRLPKRNLVEEAVRRLKTLAELWTRERIYAEGALAVIAGRPNAGKSSLFNYLLREDRSIVTDIPGTTRDWIEALIAVEDIPLRLADTAGLRDEENEVERLGIQRSLELLDKADLILYVIDGVEGVTSADREFIKKQKEADQKKPVLILWNKADLAPLPDDFSSSQETKFLAVSAKTGEGIPALTRAIALSLEAVPSNNVVELNRAQTADLRSDVEPSGFGFPSESAGPGSERQKELIDACLASLEEALMLAEKEEPLDLIAPLLRAAVNALGEITGEVSTADILKTMFGRFCVGK